MPLPSIFKQCKPRTEVLAGQLPDAIFAADLWEVITKNAHPDYQDPARFFAGTYPTENMKLLLRDVTERLAGVEGATPIYRLETGFGGGKTHSLIAAVHAAQHGEQLADLLSDYRIGRFPEPGNVRIAAFVGEASDPSNGKTHYKDGQTVQTFTPWGQIALLAGGLAGYERISENDRLGIAPEADAFREALGDRPVLILIDELVLYMARCEAVPEGHPRHKINSQWPTFIQTLHKVATHRPRTAVILTLPSDKDANRRLTAEFKNQIAAILGVTDEARSAADRHARPLTPTQSNERAAVLARRLFERVDHSAATDIARAYADYYEKQRNAGIAIENSAFESGYIEQLSAGYPFHPELIRLFSVRLADIPEFQATRGALRLIGRTVRGLWERQQDYPDALLLQPHHVDLNRSEIRDEILARLGRTAFGRGLEADVVRPEGDTHANEVDRSWPWPAATEAALVTFLHSLPDGSNGATPAEMALALGRPGIDLAYVSRGLEQTERIAWYMRRDGDRFLFRTRASINKRYQERLRDVRRQPGEWKEALDNWVQDIYANFTSFQVIPFPPDHTAIPDTADRLRLVIVHYDTECGAVGGGNTLNFTKNLYLHTGVNASPRRYRNNLLFLLSECSQVDILKDAVQSVLAWERVKKDLETEQSGIAEAQNIDYGRLRRQAQQGATGVPADFLALEHDLEDVRLKLGEAEVNVRTRLLAAYRVLAFPKGAGDAAEGGLFALAAAGPVLECYRVDFGETPEDTRNYRSQRQAVAEAPILQCLRANGKLVPAPKDNDPLVLAPAVVRRPPLWKQDERRLSTQTIWERLRQEPELPMLLKQTDLLPTLRAGLNTNPEPLWVYYNQSERRIYTRDHATALAPVIAQDHFLYDGKAAVADRIMPVAVMSPKEVWEQLWPREGTTPCPRVAAGVLLQASRTSAHCPVMPEPAVLWRALQDGVRENYWVLHMPAAHLAIGATEIGEWPSSPRFDESVEFCTYQAALDQGFYPRRDIQTTIELSPRNLRSYIWPGGSDRVSAEELERQALGTWQDLRRAQLEELLRQGVQEGVWSLWKQAADEIFYTQADALPAIHIEEPWMLVAPDCALARQLESLRPGRGPQPVTKAGTPRQALTGLWNELTAFREVQVMELTLTATSRDALDNTLIATWADRPPQAETRATVQAFGQRTAQSRSENVNLSFEGRFEEVRTMLAPIWPFATQGDLDIAITVTLRFDPPVDLANHALEAYRTALMNANQGQLEARLVPARNRRSEAA